MLTGTKTHFLVLVQRLQQKNYLFLALLANLFI